MAEMTFSPLKNIHHIREHDEKKAQERKRNLLYLISQYLREEGYFDTSSALSNEAQLTNSFQICDNIDLPLILQDFENYYYVRFQKFPKICKKTNQNSEETLLYQKRNHKLQTKKSAHDNATHHSLRQPTRSHSTTRALHLTEEKKSDLNCMSVTQLCSSPSSVNPGFKNQKTLKPLLGMGIHNSDWIQMAEMITKDIVLQDLKVRWSDIMGLDEAKKLLKEAVIYPIKYPNLFKGILSPWKGLLLFGPPGTGKTLLAKAVATECNTTFFNITATSIVSKWRGDSEKLVKVMFDLARYHAPSTIFVDELDALASSRDGCKSEHEGSRRLKTELLIQLDGLSHTEEQVFLLATSNLPWDLDPAILRRLEKKVFVNIPTVEAREAMFQHYLPEIILQQPLLKSNVNYETLAQETEGYSGSDIKVVCKETAMQALRKIFNVLEKKDNCNISHLDLPTITTSCVQEALKKTKPSASHLSQKYILWQNQFGSI